MSGIAVVVPCYNLGRTVEEAVDSVRSQTQPAAEIVIVDDGSQDLYTRQVLSRLSKSGICVIVTQNRGVAAARNLGISITSSPYIALLDADDLFEPDYLEKAAKILDSRQNLDFISCGIQAFEGASYIWYPPPCTRVEILTRGGPHISTMFRRSLWEIVGGFDERLSGYEDTDFWLSALEAGCRGDVLTEPLIRYRIRSNSRYHQAISRTTYVSTMEKIYRKHWYSVTSEVAELLAAKESFLAEQQTYHDDLRHRRDGLESEISQLHTEITNGIQEIQARGVEPLDWGDLRRENPITTIQDPNQSHSVERYYIEKFLEQHRQDIRASVLEIKLLPNSEQLGPLAKSRLDALFGNLSNTATTLVVDPVKLGDIPAETYQCVIMVHVLQFIYDFRAALSHAYRGLEPGGVLLCTVPCIRPVVQGENNGGRKDYWRFTEASIRNLFAEVFPLENFQVNSYGNVMVYAALLLGLSPDELPDGSLERDDAFFPAVCWVRAVKPMTTNSAASKMRAPTVITMREPRESCGAILFYHRIAKLTPDSHGLCVTPGDFRDHMKHLRQNYCPMSLQELVELAAKGEAPARAVAVTLDDGYVDNLTTASPILSEFNIPATFFVTTGMIDEKHEYWWDTLERVFISEQPLPAALDLYGDGSWSRRTETRVERETVHQSLIELVYLMSREERDSVINRIAAWSGIDLTPRDTHRPMLANEYVTLAERTGHIIGVHTVNHLSLPSHAVEVQLKEITESKRSLERLLGRSVTAFSYPFGEFSKETIEIVKEASFEIALTVEGRLLRIGANPFLLPRFEIKACRVHIFSEQMRLLFAAKNSPVVPEPTNH